MLYQLPASALASIVQAQRQVLRADEAAALAQVDNQGMATARLSEYVSYCVPVTIEANITKVLNNAKGSAAGITVALTQPSVMSAFVRTADFKASLPTRQAIKEQIDTLNADQLRLLATMMQLNLAVASGRIQSMVRTLDSGNLRFTNPAVAKQVLEIWVVNDSELTLLQVWADTIRRIQQL